MDDPGMVLSADSFLTDVCKAPFPKQLASAGSGDQDVDIPS